MVSRLPNALYGGGVQELRPPNDDARDGGRRPRRPSALPVSAGMLHGILPGPAGRCVHRRDRRGPDRRRRRRVHRNDGRGVSGRRRGGHEQQQLHTPERAARAAHIRVWTLDCGGHRRGQDAAPRRLAAIAGVREVSSLAPGLRGTGSDDAGIEQVNDEGDEEDGSQQLRRSLVF